MTHKHTCGGCTSTWTGMNMCHCSVCHHTFGGLEGFDRHRTADGQCRPPMSIGLFWNDKRGVWSKRFGEHVGPSASVSDETLPEVVATQPLPPDATPDGDFPYSHAIINRLNEAHSRDW